MAVIAANKEMKHEEKTTKHNLMSYPDRCRCTARQISGNGGSDGTRTGCGINDYSRDSPAMEKEAAQSVELRAPREVSVQDDASIIQMNVWCTDWKCWILQCCGLLEPRGNSRNFNANRLNSYQGIAKLQFTYSGNIHCRLCILGYRTVAVKECTIKLLTIWYILLGLWWWCLTIMLSNVSIQNRLWYYWQLPAQEYKTKDRLSAGAVHPPTGTTNWHRLWDET